MASLIIKFALTKSKSPSKITGPNLVVTVTRENSVIGRDFVITGCLTVDPPPPEKKRKKEKKW